MLKRAHPALPLKRAHPALPLKQAMPALILLALLQATQPALARGLIPVCSATGTDWIDPAGGTGDPGPDSGSPCAHGWCTSRKPRAGKA
jgi:hypothetical protein